MRIPDELNILYKKYSVKYSENIHDNEGTTLFGNIDFMDQTIQLNPAQSDEQARSTLIHEIVHGLDEMYIIGLKEKQVEKLGVALYMFIRDNPGMFREEVAG